MKKILFLAGAVVLLAAACNSQTAVKTNTNTGSNTTAQTGTQNGAKAQVDTTVNDINNSISGEATASSQSDADLLNQEQSVVNDANGVSNANY